MAGDLGNPRGVRHCACVNEINRGLLVFEKRKLNSLLAH
jgi:hypothetical protein